MSNVPNFVFAACKYSLGDAVGEQLEDAVRNGEGFEAQNPAALRLCLEWLEDNQGDVADHFTDDANAQYENMVMELDEYLNREED